MERERGKLNREREYYDFDSKTYLFKLTRLISPLNYVYELQNEKQSEIKNKTNIVLQLHELIQDMCKKLVGEINGTIGETKMIDVLLTRLWQR